VGFKAFATAVMSAIGLCFSFQQWDLKKKIKVPPDVFSDVSASSSGI